MARVFDIEENFPVTDVRLPRRQAGSPQGLGVTLIADYTLSARAWLPSAAIVDLLGEFGVTNGSARTTISRLARWGVLEGKRGGRNGAYRLTDPAADNLSHGGRQIAEVGAGDLGRLVDAGRVLHSAEGEHTAARDPGTSAMAWIRAPL